MITEQIFGDGLEIKTLSGVTSILSDHGTAGQYDKTIMSLTGSSDVLTSKVSVSGELMATNCLSITEVKSLLATLHLFIVHDGTNGKINNSTGSLSINTDTEGAAVNIGHSTSEVNIGDNLVVNGNTTTEGDLTVNGSLTSINTTNYNVNDRLIKLGDGNLGSSHDLGIYLQEVTVVYLV